MSPPQADDESWHEQGRRHHPGHPPFPCGWPFSMSVCCSHSGRASQLCLNGHQDNHHRVKVLSIHQIHLSDVSGVKSGSGQERARPRRRGSSGAGGAPGLHAAGPKSNGARGRGGGDPAARRAAASRPRSAPRLALATAPRAQPIAPRRRGYPRALTESNPGAGGGPGGRRPLRTRGGAHLPRPHLRAR